MVVFEALYGPDGEVVELVRLDEADYEWDEDYEDTATRDADWREEDRNA